ncbi:MAG: hypothetical protein IJE92_03450, partial [Clostridia bacterium]|nr:hypothetical protein [Clostridia bacterium]
MVLAQHNVLLALSKKRKHKPFNPRQSVAGYFLTQTLYFPQLCGKVLSSTLWVFFTQRSITMQQALQFYLEQRKKILAQQYAG